MTIQGVALLITYKMTSGINLNNRNAFDIINILRNFDGTVYIEKSSEQRQANAKSLLGLLSLNIMCGDNINLIAQGEFAKKMMDSIKIVFCNK